MAARTSQSQRTIMQGGAYWRPAEGAQVERTILCLDYVQPVSAPTENEPAGWHYHMNDTVRGKYIPIFQLGTASDGTLHRKALTASNWTDRLTVSWIRKHDIYLYTTKEGNKEFLLVDKEFRKDLKTRWSIFMSTQEIQDYNRYRRGAKRIVM